MCSGRDGTILAETGDAAEMFRKFHGLFIAIGSIIILGVSAHASPRCVEDQKPFALAGDTTVWTMYAAPGSQCIQGLRWSYMQIYTVSVSKAPTKGKIVIVGPGFRYFAASKDYEADNFTLEVVGKNRRDPGKSTLQIVVKRPVETVVGELRLGP
jgi:hypothetical protein